MEQKIEVLSIVYSKAGRDRGRYFVVTHLEGDYVQIVDGALRKLAHPKKKKVKHLVCKPKKAEGIRLQDLQNGKLLDSDIRKCLAQMGFSIVKKED